MCIKIINIKTCFFLSRKKRNLNDLNIDTN